MYLQYFYRYDFFNFHKLCSKLQNICNDDDDEFISVDWNKWFED